MRAGLVVALACAACEMAPGGALEVRQRPTVPVVVERVPPAKPVPPEPVLDELDIQLEVPAGVPFDPAAVQATMSPFTNRLRECGGDFTGKLAVSVKVAPTGAVDDVAVVPDALPARCIANVIRSATFSRTRAGFDFTYPINFAGCNADALARQGDAKALADPAAALGKFEASLACTYDAMVVPRAYAAACGSKATAKAQAYFAQLPRERQGHLVQVCLSQGIDPLQEASAERALGEVAVRLAVNRVTPQIVSCDNGSFSGRFHARPAIAPDGSVERVDVTPSIPLSACVAAAIRTAKFEPSVNGGMVSYPIVFGATPTAVATALAAVSGCDPAIAKAMEARGDREFDQGNPAPALAAYERALVCEWDPKLIVKAYVAACNAKAADRAKAYFSRLPVERQNALSQICLKFGIDPSAPHP
jgi:hypothetical protein